MFTIQCVCMCVYVCRVCDRGMKGGVGKDVAFSFYIAQNDKNQLI